MNSFQKETKKKFDSGVKWLTCSVTIAIVSTSSWLVYSRMYSQSSGTVEVSLVAVEKGTVEDLINESGTVELGGQQTLKSPVDGGIVEQVLVTLDDRVTLGQKLIVLRNSERQTALAQQQLEIQKQQLTLERSHQKAAEASQLLTSAQQKLQTLAAEQTEIDKQQLQLARNHEKVLESTDKLNAAREELQQLRVLLEKGFIPENELQQQKDDILTAQSELRDARLAVETTALDLQRLQSQQQSRQQEISTEILTARGQLQDADLEVNTNTRELERLRLEAQKIEQEIQNNTIGANFRGRVLDIKTKVGDVVELGDPLIVLGDTSQELVKLQLSPLDAVRVQPNQTARISIIGPQAESFTGRVQNVSKVATTSEENSDSGDSEDLGQATVTATVKLDRPSQIMIPGSKVDVEIIVAASENVVTLSREIIQGAASETFVWVRDERGKAQKRPVTLGLEGLTTVEVTSGLKPGDRVVVPQSERPLKSGTPLAIDGEQS